MDKPSEEQINKVLNNPHVRDVIEDHATIYAYGDKAKRKGKPVYTGRRRRASYTSELPLYLLWCEPCQQFTLTHPAGHGRITCQHCRQNSHRVMTWTRFRDKRLKVYLFWLPRLLLIPTLLFLVYLIVSR